MNLVALDDINDKLKFSLPGYTLPLQVLVKNMAYHIYHQIINYHDTIPLLGKKEHLLEFILQVRKKIVKLLVVVKWFELHGSITNKYQASIQYLSEVDMKIRQTADELFFFKNILGTHCAVKYDVPSAIGFYYDNYSNMPTSIRSIAYDPNELEIHKERLTSQMDHLCRIKLFQEKNINGDIFSSTFFKSITFLKGNVELVCEEFEIMLTVASTVPFNPKNTIMEIIKTLIWELVDLKIHVAFYQIEEAKKVLTNLQLERIKMIFKKKLSTSSLTKCLEWLHSFCLELCLQSLYCESKFFYGKIIINSSYQKGILSVNYWPEETFTINMKPFSPLWIEEEEVDSSDSCYNKNKKSSTHNLQIVSTNLHFERILFAVIKENQLNRMKQLYASIIGSSYSEYIKSIEVNSKVLRILIFNLWIQISIGVTGSFKVFIDGPSTSYLTNLIEQNLVDNQKNFSVEKLIFDVVLIMF